MGKDHCSRIERKIMLRKLRFLALIAILIFAGQPLALAYTDISTNGKAAISGLEERVSYGYV